MQSNGSSGVVKCSRCKGFYIKEEYDLHRCQKLAIEIFDTDGNHWGSYDKHSFFRLPQFKRLSSNDVLHRDDSNDNVTEPLRDIYITNYFILKLMITLSSKKS
jgi:hypothetical protein